jgi:hypothetical protein
MKSPPAIIESTRVITSRPGREDRGDPQVHAVVDDRFEARMLAELGGQQQPGCGHRVVVVEGHGDPIETVR